MKHLATLLLIVALVGLALLGLTESRVDPAPVVRTAWQQPTQPENRLFSVCPLDQRNLPHANERSA